MKTYCVSCKKNIESGNSSVRKTKQKRLMLSSNCAVCGKKKLRFVKNPELHSVVFSTCNNIWNDDFKMNKIVNKFLLAGIRQSWFTYGAFGIFTKHFESIQKFRETVSLKHVYRSELDKPCFAHDAAYSDSKDLANRTISDKVFQGRAINWTINFLQEDRIGSWSGCQWRASSKISLSSDYEIQKKESLCEI